MEINAKLKYLRIAPRKVRLVADLIKGKQVEQAQTILNFTVRRAAVPLLKLLKSAIANAKNNFQIDEKNLRIKKIIVDEGPKFKRWRPRASGRAYEIQKKTSHVILVLNEIKKVPSGLKKAGQALKKEGEKEAEKVSKQGIKKSKFRPKLKVPKPIIEKKPKTIFRRKAF